MKWWRVLKEGWVKGRDYCFDLSHWRSRAEGVGGLTHPHSGPDFTVILTWGEPKGAGEWEGGGRMVKAYVVMATSQDTGQCSSPSHWSFFYSPTHLFPALTELLLAYAIRVHPNPPYQLDFTHFRPTQQFVTPQ